MPKLVNLLTFFVCWTILGSVGSLLFFPMVKSIGWVMAFGVIVGWIGFHAGDWVEKRYRERG
jgi:hypothetical protein